MDSYIKMCEKAEQIQKLWKNKKSHIEDKIYIKHLDEYILIIKEIEFWNDEETNKEYITFEKRALKPIPFTEWDKDTFYKYENGELNVIYLPTQEQLQEIAMKLPSLKGRVMKPFWELADQFAYFLWDDETRKYASKFEAFNELWLAFVMKEKFKKSWNKEKKEWEKIK